MENRDVIEAAYGTIEQITRWKRSTHVCPHVPSTRHVPTFEGHMMDVGLKKMKICLHCYILIPLCGDNSSDAVGLWSDFEFSTLVYRIGQRVSVLLQM